MHNDDLDRLVLLSTIQNYQKDNIIFFQGDESKFMHILLEGSVRIYKSKPSGGEVQLMRVNAVDTIAELACFEGIPYPASSITTSTAKISFGIIKSLSLKLRSLSSLIERELTLSSEQKVAKFIIDNEERLKTIKQVDIASELNITPETLSRMLKKLYKQEFIQSTNPPIIKDIKGLKEIYNLF